GRHDGAPERGGWCRVDALQRGQVVQRSRDAVTDQPAVLPHRTASPIRFAVSSPPPSPGGCCREPRVWLREMPPRKLGDSAAAGGGSAGMGTWAGHAAGAGSREVGSLRLVAGIPCRAVQPVSRDQPGRARWSRSGRTTAHQSPHGTTRGSCPRSLAVCADHTTCVTPTHPVTQEARKRAQRNRAHAKEADMTTTERQLADLFVEMTNTHNPDLVDRFIAEDYVNHNDFVADGREANRQFWTAFFTGLPDVKVTMQDLVVS